MLTHQDFAPQLVKTGFLGSTFESFVDVSAKASHWVFENNVDVISVETVQMTIVEAKASGPTARQLEGVRVWYWHVVK